MSGCLIGIDTISSRALKGVLYYILSAGLCCRMHEGEVRMKKQSRSSRSHSAFEDGKISKKSVQRDSLV